MKRCITPRLSLLLVFFLFGFIPARAQQMIKPATDSPETNVSERVRLLESELERQNTKLDQLQKTLAEQQATIHALLEKLSAQPTNTAAATEIEQVRKGGLPPPTGNSEVTVAVTPEPQTPTVEQRLTKLEGQALKIGPVRER